MVVVIGIGEGINRGTETVISYAVSTNSHQLSVSYFRFMGVFTLIVGSSVVVLVYLFRDGLFGIYTNEKIILRIISEESLIPILTLGAIIFRQYLIGTVRALNVDKPVFFMNLFSNIINGGLMYLFAFHMEKTKGLQGLWLAKAAFEGLINLMMLVYLWQKDWMVAIEENKKIMGNSR